MVAHTPAPVYPSTRLTKCAREVGACLTGDVLANGGSARALNVGWQPSTSLRTHLALDALDMGLWTRARDGHQTNALVHHSYSTSSGNVWSHSSAKRTPDETASGVTGP